MFNIRLTLLAVFALLAVSAIADSVKIDFNCVGKWVREDNGKKKTERVPLYKEVQVASEKVMGEMTSKFPTWSGGKYTCEQSRHRENLYNVEVVEAHFGKNKNDALAQNQEMLSIINAHKNDNVQ